MFSAFKRMVVRPFLTRIAGGRPKSKKEDGVGVSGRRAAIQSKCDFSEASFVVEDNPDWPGSLQQGKLYFKAHFGTPSVCGLTVLHHDGKIKLLFTELDENIGFHLSHISSELAFFVHSRLYPDYKPSDISWFEYYPEKAFVGLSPYDFRNITYS